MRWTITHEIDGYYDAVAPTLEEAKDAVFEEDFGDLYDIDWYETDHFTDKDGNINASFHVQGYMDVDVTADSLEEAIELSQDVVNETDFKHLYDIGGGFHSYERMEPEPDMERDD